jgi:hypothetical protein
LNVITALSAGAGPAVEYRRMYYGFSQQSATAPDAEPDEFTVAMPNPALLTLGGIAPQCVITDIRVILDRPRSLRA